MTGSSQNKRFAVALHLFWEDDHVPGHGYTDSARCTVEASDEFEAVVLATALAMQDAQAGYHIANACPSVRPLELAKETA